MMLYQPSEGQAGYRHWQISDEASLYPLWQKQRGNTFMTSAGPVTILEPGELNVYAGPDFRNAVIRFGAGDIRCGDVELHNRVEDWSRHHHTNNPDYAGVVLHVVSRGNNARVRLNDFYSVPTIVLGAEGHPGASGCQSLEAQLGPEPFEKLIRHFSHSRWEYLQACFSDGSPESLVRRILTQADPKSNRTVLAKVVRYLTGPIAAGESPILTVLQDAAAFTEAQPWIMGRKRPGSHPRYRVPLLVLLASLLTLKPEQVRHITLATLKGYSQLLGSRGFYTPGRSTLEEIMGNIVLPLTAVVTGDELFERWFALPVQTYGFTRKRLNIWGYQRKITFGFQQGLLQFESDYCRPAICTNCPLINCQVLIA